MTRLHEEIEVARPIEEAFDYVADFAKCAEWDPGIAEGRRVGEGPIGVGSRFEVVADFNGRRMPLTYEITEFERPRRVVLAGEGSTFRGLDEIGFAAAPSGGTRITYAADIRLKGLLAIAEPFMKGRFAEMGRKAVAGLKARLDGEAPPAGER